MDKGKPRKTCVEVWFILQLVISQRFNFNARIPVLDVQRSFRNLTSIFQMLLEEGIHYKLRVHSTQLSSQKVVKSIEFTVSVVSCKTLHVILWSFKYFIQDIYVLVNSSQRVRNMQGHITTNESES